MEYGLQISGTYDSVLEGARWAEANGMVAVALPDHFLTALDEEEARTRPAPDALIQLGGLARETEAIELVVLVSPITFRHPAVLLKTAITLDRMSGGRFALGVGTGWMAREHEVFGLPFPSVAERFELLEEALGYLRAGLDPDHPGFTGSHYRLEAFPIAPQPLRPVPLVIGGTGAHKTPRLAGKYADEFNCYPGPEFAERIGRARSAASEAGRDPAALRISSAGQIVATATEAEFEAEMDRMAAEAKISRDELETHFERRKTPRGTYAQVKEQLAAMEEAGLERLYFQVGAFERDRIERLIFNLVA